MTLTVLTVLILTLYPLAAWLLGRGVFRPSTATAIWFAPAAAAVLLHTLFHVLSWRAVGGLDLHFFAALSLVGLGMAALTAIVGVAGRMQTLGTVVFPLSALSFVAYRWAGFATATQIGWRLQLHAGLALLAYATLAIAALLALMLWAQERALRRRDFNAWQRVLPPLTELESLLFRTIAVGLLLLTATLLTGLLFVDDLLAQHLVHKTVLSVLSWLAFGALLIGRWRYGWRGAVAVRWTLAAMALLGLAFFGSKLVLELVLNYS